MEAAGTQRTPTSIGIIMDGNRRWARREEIDQLEGHTRGYQKLKELVDWAKEYGIEHVIVYAFSTENWNRAQEEVSYLMDLFRFVVQKEVDALSRDGVRIRFAGDKDQFPKDLAQMMREAEEQTAHHTNHTLTIAASYGGRAELVHAYNAMRKDGVVECDEETLGRYLWIPESPDLIIRTGGEKRLSNFLLWQAAYSELIFTDTYWPDFSKEEFSAMIDTYATRERRHGR